MKHFLHIKGPTLRSSPWRRSDETFKLKSGIQKGGKAPDAAFWATLWISTAGNVFQDINASPLDSETRLTDLELRVFLLPNVPKQML